MHILLVKARIKGDDKTFDLFDMPVRVEAYTRKDGTPVKAHTEVRKVRKEEEKPIPKVVAVTEKQTPKKQETPAEKDSILTAGISYTLPNDPSIPAHLRGKTLTGGKPTHLLVGDKPEPIVRFSEEVQGKPISLRLSGRPDLAELVDKYHAAETSGREREKQNRNASIPGLDDLRRATINLSKETERYHRQFNRMMEDEGKNGKMPRSADKDIQARVKVLEEQYPRAALYLRAEQQHASTHWADSAGKGAAATKAMRILESGGTIEAAEAALKERREVTD